MFTVFFKGYSNIAITKDNYFTLKEKLPEVANINNDRIYFVVETDAEDIIGAKLTVSHETNFVHYPEIEGGLDVFILKAKETTSENFLPLLRYLLDCKVAEIGMDGCIAIKKNPIKLLIDAGEFDFNQSVFVNLVKPVLELDRQNVKKKGIY